MSSREDLNAADVELAEGGSTSQVAADDDVASSIEVEDHTGERQRRKLRMRLTRAMTERHDQKQQGASSCHYCRWAPRDGTSKGLRWWFRHPLPRLLVASGIAFLNFYILAEDPIAHSHSEVNIPIIGNGLSLLFHHYPEDAPGLWALKFFCAVAAVITGMLVGRQVIHRFLRDKLHLEMFSGPYGTNGSWMTMFFTTILIGWIWSHIYNALLDAVGDNNEEWHIDDKFGITNEEFMKIAGSGTFIGDWITFYMVFDLIFQDRTEYPKWAPGNRAAYNVGALRIILFWCAVPSLTIIVVSIISTDAINWDSYGNSFTQTSELGRAVLASIITAMDLCIVMQDFDFPTFKASADIKLPGLDVHEVNWRFGWLSQRLRDWCHVHISGKWFNFGIIFVVMMLDMNMLKNQVVYVPADFAQYTDPDDRVWTITNGTEIDDFLEHPNDPRYTWDVRQGCCGDIMMESMYKDWSAAVMGLALVPCLFAASLFFVLIRMEGWKAFYRKQDEAEQAEYEAEQAEQAEQAAQEERDSQADGQQDEDSQADD